MSCILKNAEEFPRQRKRRRVFQIKGTVCERLRRRNHIAHLEIIKMFPLLIYLREGTNDAFDLGMKTSIRISLQPWLA